MNALRVAGYRLLGYHIRKSHIGFGTIIAVSSARLWECRIGAYNLFLGPMSVIIEEGAAVGNLNMFACGYWTLQDKYGEYGYSRSLTLGRDAVITSRHYFDVAGELALGDRSWIAGMGSQFWTHGAGVRERDIHIGRDCYVGSAVRFAPGSSVADLVLVAMGSVVTRKFDESSALIGGVPANVLKSSYDWKQLDGVNPD